METETHRNLESPSDFEPSPEGVNEEERVLQM